MVIAKEDGTLEAAEQIIDTAVPSLAEGELPVTISLPKINNPEETPGVHRSSQVRFQNKPYYIPIVVGNPYETVNTQV